MNKSREIFDIWYISKVWYTPVGDHMAKLQQMFFQSLGLSLAQQEEIKKIWDSRNIDPKAYIPSKFRDKISVAEAMEANKQFGLFGCSYQKMILGLSVADSIVVGKRFSKESKVVAVGYGCGYDSDWFGEAVDAGFETHWIDVSDVSGGEAAEDLENQYKKTAPGRIICPKPKVHVGEIQSILVNPESIDLDLSTVEMWYLCRLLGCLSPDSSEIVLQMLGLHTMSADADPEKTKGIVIINALRDYNRDYESKTSTLLSKKMILKNVEKGAGRKMKIFNEASYKYFDKIVTAMIIKA